MLLEVVSYITEENLLVIYDLDIDLTYGENTTVFVLKYPS